MNKKLHKQAHRTLPSPHNHKHIQLKTLLITSILECRQKETSVEINKFRSTNVFDFMQTKYEETYLTRQK